MSIISCTSPRPSETILPASSVTTAPSAAFDARNSSPSRRTSSPRRGAGTSRQAAKAAFARAIVAGASLAGVSAMRAISLPSIGLRTDSVPPESSASEKPAARSTSCPVRIGSLHAPQFGRYRPQMWRKGKPRGKARDLPLAQRVVAGLSPVSYISQRRPCWIERKSNGAVFEYRSRLCRDARRDGAGLCYGAAQADGPRQRQFQPRGQYPVFVRAMAKASGRRGHPAEPLGTRERALQPGSLAGLCRSGRAHHHVHGRLWREPERPPADASSRGLLHGAGLPRQSDQDQQVHVVAGRAADPAHPADREPRGPSRADLLLDAHRLRQYDEQLGAAGAEARLRPPGMDSG